MCQVFGEHLAGGERHPRVRLPHAPGVGGEEAHQHLLRVQHRSRYRSAPAPGTALAQVQISTCSGYSTGPGTDQHLLRVQHWPRYRSASAPGTALVQVQISTCYGYSTGPRTDQHLLRVQRWSRYRSAPAPGTTLVQVQHLKGQCREILGGAVGIRVQLRFR